MEKKIFKAFLNFTGLCSKVLMVWYCLHRDPWHTSSGE